MEAVSCKGNYAECVMKIMRETAGAMGYICDYLYVMK